MSCRDLRRGVVVLEGRPCLCTLFPVTAEPSPCPFEASRPHLSVGILVSFKSQRFPHFLVHPVVPHPPHLFPFFGLEEVLPGAICFCLVPYPTREVVAKFRKQEGGVVFRLLLSAQQPSHHQEEAATKARHFVGKGSRTGPVRWGGEWPCPCFSAASAAVGFSG